MRSPAIDVRERSPYSVDQFPLKDEYRPSVESVLVSEGEIECRVARLAEEISRVYQERDGVQLNALCVLKGAMRFFGALVPQLDFEGTLSEGVVRASRYSGGTAESERTELQWMQPELIEGTDVLVVEDIIDEGFTLETILRELQQYDPASIEVVVLFDKTARRKTDIDIGFTGFVLPDEFVVGYGLDYGERFRNVRHLAILDEQAVQ